MKNRFIIGAVLCVALIATLLIVVNRTRATPVGLVELRISGPEGQHFRGTYCADGVTNTLNGVVPTSVSFPAREASFELLREGEGGEFRVVLYSGGLLRTSTASGCHQGVRGKCTGTVWWAEAFGP